MVRTPGGDLWCSRLDEAPKVDPPGFGLRDVTPGWISWAGALPINRNVDLLRFNGRDASSRPLISRGKGDGCACPTTWVSRTVHIRPLAYPVFPMGDTEFVRRQGTMTSRTKLELIASQGSSCDAPGRLGPAFQPRPSIIHHGVSVVTAVSVRHVQPFGQAKLRRILVRSTRWVRE